MPGTKRYLLGIMVVMLPGCAFDATQSEEAPTEAEQDLINTNAITSNAITSNAITSNAITSNALNFNTLASSVVTELRDPGTTGANSRMFARYAVSCAFSTSQTFSFSWTDSSGVVHNESYAGELGIAPSWATGPLDDDGQRMVSACVAARVNYYGTSVTLSIRSLQDSLKTKVGSQELIDYPNVEGAFWGNLFGASKFINACYNSPTVANSRAKKRDCAAGHLNADGTTSQCGIINIVGPCSNVCQTLNGAGQYYPSCIEKPGVNMTTTKLVVTTALP